MTVQSFFAMMLLELQTRIALVPEIRWIDLDFGQLEYYDPEGRPPVSLPCVLIDFDDTTYDDLGNLVEDGTVNIGVRLAFQPYSPTNNKAPLEVSEMGLKYFELENKVFKVLKGWCPESNICQPLNRRSAATEKREDPYRVRKMIFTTSFQDSEASPEKQTVTPLLDFEYEITTEI